MLHSKYSQSFLLRLHSMPSSNRAQTSTVFTRGSAWLRSFCLVFNGSSVSSHFCFLRFVNRCEVVWCRFIASLAYSYSDCVFLPHCLGSTRKSNSHKQIINTNFKFEQLNVISALLFLKSSSVISNKLDDQTKVLNSFGMLVVGFAGLIFGLVSVSSFARPSN